MTSTQQGAQGRTAGVADGVVYMPALGESVEEGTVTRWLKQVGDRVEAEEPLLEVATDKVDTEIVSPHGGTVMRLLVDENDVVAVGAELAAVQLDDRATDGGGNGGASPTASHQVSAPEPNSATATEAHSGAAEVAPPSVAQEVPTTANAVKLPRIRRTIAARMVESLRVSAQLTTVLEVDLTTVARLRKAHKSQFHARTGTKLSFLPFFVRAAVAALPDHPMLNASLDADVTEVTYHDGCHLGIAVDGPKGLMVPVIRDAHQLGLARIAQQIAELAERVRSSTITADELAGGTFTITNTGSRGALFDTPIINQPQTGILGTGAVIERLVPVRDDHDALRIEVRPMAYLSITYDHRIVDGADAARYLTAVKKYLESGFTDADLEG
ncbi:2-oxo acid dehydrogenase subunit E2 [Mycobacterium sp. smrl_JER01]|uniref:2-oxo acid dehydrogenase subunit E2 n=1 Tax=Mycobacterium sp. smrl_JER01 TaxID=3402633 RepID=UPI003ABE0EB2